MSVPPRTPREQPGWEVAGEDPTPPRPRHGPDKLGVGLVGAVLLAIVVAAILLIVM